MRPHSIKGKCQYFKLQMKNVAKLLLMNNPIMDLLLITSEYLNVQLQANKYWPYVLEICGVWECIYHDFWNDTSDVEEEQEERMQSIDGRINHTNKQTKEEETKQQCIPCVALCISTSFWVWPMWKSPIVIKNEWCH